jgi:ParB family chromosome partitioning protein
VASSGRRSLGHGLEALLSIQGDPVKNAEPYLQNLPINVLAPNKYQPRSQFDTASLQELAASIEAQGILQPIIVRKNKDKYEIVAGERRWRAAQMAGLTIVPAVIHEIDDHSALAFALVENIQRQDLNPIEEAQALQRLLTEFSLTHDMVAKAVGRSRVAVTNLLRLLNLAEPVKELIKERKLEMGHGRALLALEGDLQERVAQQIVDKGLSVRQAERLIKSVNLLQLSNETIEDSTDSFLKNRLNQWGDQLSKHLSSIVKVSVNRKGEGKITIQTSSVRELEKLIEHFSL